MLLSLNSVCILTMTYNLTVSACMSHLQANNRLILDLHTYCMHALYSVSVRTHNTNATNYQMHILLTIQSIQQKQSAVNPHQSVMVCLWYKLLDVKDIYACNVIT